MNLYSQINPYYNNLYVYMKYSIVQIVFTQKLIPKKQPKTYRPVSLSTKLFLIDQNDFCTLTVFIKQCKN